MMRVCAEKGTDFSLKKSVLFGQKVRTFLIKDPYFFFKSSNVFCWEV